MKIFSDYLKARFKLIFKFFPGYILFFLIFLAVMGLLVSVYVNGPFSEKKTKYKIAVAGDTESSFLGFGVSVIKSFDDSRFAIDFVSMDMAEAKNALMREDVSAVIYIPKGFVDSVATGANDVRVQVMLSEGHTDVIGLTKELFSKIVSDMITNSQSSVYTFYKSMHYLGQDDLADISADTLNLKLISAALGRTGMLDIKSIGVSDGLTTIQYYYCAVIGLFLLLLGIPCASLLGGEKGYRAAFLKAKGLGIMAQVLAEYLTYLLLMVFGMGLVYTILGIALSRQEISGLLGKISDMGAGLQFLYMLPIIAMISAMQYMIYEICRSVVGSLLAQFTVLISMAYISGFFYPAAAFPKAVRALGGTIPTGVLFKGLEASVIGEICGGVYAAGFAYLMLFFAISVLARYMSSIRR